MTEYRMNRPPELKRRLSLPFLTGSIAVVLVMVALPISQMVSGTPQPPPPDLDSSDYERPPDMIPPDPQIDKREDIEKPDFKDDIEPPTIDQLVILNNPDLGGFDSTSYTISVGGSSDGIQDIVHTLDQLTRAPQPLRQAQPIYPHNLKTMGIEGEVVLTFIVRADGSTSNIKAISSSNPEFERPAMKSVRKWLFQPGEKDGKAVNTIVRIQIPFRINSGL